MKKKKIIHTIPSLSKGGAERLVVDLCNTLAENPELEVTLVSFYDNSVSSSFISELSTKVNYISFNKRSGFDLNLLSKLTRYLLRENPDILHSHINSFEYTFLFLSLNKMGKHLHTVHCLAKDECPNPVIKFLRKISYTTKRSIPITISEEGQDSFNDYYRLSNSILIENGTRKIEVSDAQPSLLKQYKSNQNQFLLVNVARIVPEKNQGLLIDAVNLFNDRHDKKIMLLIIGEERDKKLKNDLLVKAQDSSFIEFLGGKSNIGDYLSIADAFCLSSIHEGMPISLIESFSMGCIPICTPVGGMQEMIRHGVTGFLSKDSTKESLATAFEECFSSDNIRLIKENCQMEFETKYAIQLVAERHEKAYFQK